MNSFIWLVTRIASSQKAIFCSFSILQNVRIWGRKSRKLFNDFDTILYRVKHFICCGKKPHATTALPGTRSPLCTFGWGRAGDRAGRDVAAIRRACSCLQSNPEKCYLICMFGRKLASLASMGVSAEWNNVNGGRHAESFNTSRWCSPENVFTVGGADPLTVRQPHSSSAQSAALNILSVHECLQPELYLSQLQNGPLYVFSAEHPPSCTARGRTMMWHWWHVDRRNRASLIMHST